MVVTSSVSTTVVSTTRGIGCRNSKPRVLGSVSIGVEIASRLIGVGDDGVLIPERTASEKDGQWLYASRTGLHTRGQRLFVFVVIIEVFRLTGRLVPRHYYASLAFL